MMKRFILIQVFSLTIGGLGFIAGCKEKTSPQEKTAVDSPSAPKTATVTNDSTTTAALNDTTQAGPAETAAPARQKFGYINSAELLQLMPETKRAEANLNAYVRTLENKFGTLQKDYQKKITEFQSQEQTMVDAVKQSRIQAISQLEQQMQQTQVTSQQQIAAKRESLFKPILDKAEKAIQDVGKENNYDYVFDTNTGSFIYAKESHNILPLVKTKLGLK